MQNQLKRWAFFFLIGIIFIPFWISMIGVIATTGLQTHPESEFYWVQVMLSSILIVALPTLLLGLIIKLSETALSPIKASFATILPMVLFTTLNYIRSMFDEVRVPLRGEEIIGVVTIIIVPVVFSMLIDKIPVYRSRRS